LYGVDPLGDFLSVVVNSCIETYNVNTTFAHEVSVYTFQRL